MKPKPHHLSATVICFCLACCSNSIRPEKATSHAIADPTPQETYVDFIKNRLAPEERAIGKYKNRYVGNSDLAGVEVYQKPFAENTVEDYREYIGADKHPGTINYHFWDGRVLETDYSPKGKCLRSDWTSHTVYEAPGYYRSWEMVDFSKGSDPEFKHHKDPRKEPMRSLYPPSTQ